MFFCDLHADTISKLYEHEEQLASNNCAVDLNKLRISHYILQTFALFVKLDRQNPYQYFLTLLQKFEAEMKLNCHEIGLVKNYDDIINNFRNGRLSALLTLEEGGIIGDDLKKLVTLYERGVRLITLTWNFENSLGYPNSHNNHYPYAELNKGLKPFGIKAIQKMEELGIIIDVSHLSDKGFYDVYKNTTRPFVASHSNARAICEHPRNLTDEMIKLIVARKGLIGLNFCPFFLANGAQESRIADMLLHLNHFKKLNALNYIALGSDFDGISGILEIKDASRVYQLVLALRDEGYSEEEIRKICYKNALDFFKRYFNGSFDINDIML